MNKVPSWLFAIACSLTFSSLIPLPAQATSFVNSLSIPGEMNDLSPVNSDSGGANINRFGFFSDIYYDRPRNVYYGLSDRGPGGGLLPYETRVQKFTLDVDANTGAISNFNLLRTIRFQDQGEPFNGLNPSVLNGDKSILGQSFDPEGFVIAPNGNFYVADEYGPSLYEFRPNGSLVRAFQIPDNILPKVGDTLNYLDGRGTLTSGRQDNRGFEGLAISPDGSKLFAMLQDPLINEGDLNEGRRSRNLRLVEFDTATGESTAQYIYQLEDIADINDRIPGTEQDFTATAQGRNIGISAIIALNESEFFVLERDNRGIGVDDPLGINPVGSKRVYRINLTGATDVSGISLAGTNNLPLGVNPVTKTGTPLIDVAAALASAGLSIPEKLEGLTIGPRLNDGSYAIILGTDNDYSVTQTGSGTQFDVCSDGSQVAIDSGCLNGSTLIPGYLYSFKATAAEIGDYVEPVTTTPEPTALVGLLFAGLGSLSLRRKH